MNRYLVCVITLVSIQMVAPLRAAQAPLKVELASISSKGIQGDLFSVDPEISGDGNAVVFISMSSNLADGVTGPGMSIYLRVPATLTTTLVSANGAGVRANATSVDPAIAANGRYVAFSSYATNLTSDQTFHKKQVFRKDLATRVVALVSVDGSGMAKPFDSTNPSLSTDGNMIAFMSSAVLASGCEGTQRHIYVRDLIRRTTTCVSRGSHGKAANGSSFQPSISRDGTRVAFYSSASNLVPGDHNNANDVFVRDLSQGVTIMVSATSAGGSSNGASLEPSISGDGTRVAFTSYASNLISGSTNGIKNIFIRDLTAGKTFLVSSRDGSTIADGPSGQPRLSGDGRTVVFMSLATNLTRFTTNAHRKIFAMDIEHHRLRQVSVPIGSMDVDGDSSHPTVSADGSVVAFMSNASNLVTTDTNFTDDVFIQKIYPANTDTPAAELSSQ